MDTKRFSLVKPSVETPFHIDFTWWKQHDSDWHIYLFACLCSTHKQSLGNIDFEIAIDWVDANTAEVKQVDPLQHVLMSHCARQIDFISPHTPLVDSVFRLLMANGNNPITPVEFSQKLGKQPEVILRTLTGQQVHKGIRPILH